MFSEGIKHKTWMAAFHADHHSAGTSAAGCMAVAAADSDEVGASAGVYGSAAVADADGRRVVALQQLLGCATQRIRVQWPAQQEPVSWGDVRNPCQ